MKSCVIDRCVLITNGNLAVMVALAPWIKKYRKNIVKIYITHRLPAEKSNIKGLLRMLYKSGWDYTYLKLWVNKIAPLIVKLKGWPADLADYISRAKLDIPIEKVYSVNEPRVIEEIKGMGTQLLISYAATEKFCNSLINAPLVGAINVHPSPLPAYAGLSPYFWELYNEEPNYGFTLHRIVSRLDAGPIIEQLIEQAGDTRTVLRIIIRMTEVASEMLTRFFEGTTGFDRQWDQDLSKRSYFRHPTRAQVKDFKARGYRMLDSASKAHMLERVQEVAEELK